MSEKIPIKDENGIENIETVDSKAEVGSREFRLAALLSFCTPEEAVTVLNNIDNDYFRKQNLRKAVDISFILSIASQELGKKLTNNDLEYALVKVGIDPDENF